MLERLSHGAGYWVWRAGAALVQRLPPGFVYSCAVLGGELAYLFWNTKREIAKHNLSVVLGRPQDHPEVARVARRSFRNFGKYLTEIMRFPKLHAADLERMVTIDDRSNEHLQQALDHGKGLIFVSAHFGNFELGGARIAQESAPIVVAAVKRERDNSFRGTALPPIFVERTKQTAKDLEQATQSIVRALEGLIRPDPDQWYIFRPMWPESAQG